MAGLQSTGWTENAGEALSSHAILGSAMIPPISAATFIAFALITLGMALTPGPKMIYLLSRSILQGRAASFISLMGVLLGLTQIAISFKVNGLIVLSAGTLAAWFATRPSWLKPQRWLMASVIAGLAIRLALEKRAD